MKFRYKKFPVDRRNCPFTNKRYALRPVIEVDFKDGENKFGYLVLIDSGADYCIFHATIGEQLNLDIKTGKQLIFSGTSGEPQKAYFHKITFYIWGHPHTCEVGFSYEMEKLAYGILGQDGFFDKWKVEFEYHKERIQLKEIV